MPTLVLLSDTEDRVLACNAFAYAVNPKGRFKPTLLRIEKMGEGCGDFVLLPDRKLAFRSGQYLDWTLDVPNSDNRGNRRPFTIASAPTDEEVLLGVKFYPGDSTFKRQLAAMQPGVFIHGSHLSGSFVLPKDRETKLAFIAGGIGITPCRSMVQDVIRTQNNRPATLLYGNNSIDEIAYSALFEQAERELRLRTIHALAQGEAGYSNVLQRLIDTAMIEREISPLQDRMFYLSGPRAMVVNFQRVRQELGIARSRFKVDFFPGCV